MKDRKTQNPLDKIQQQTSEVLKRKKDGNGTFEKFATKITLATGSTPAFVVALAVVVAWLISGPFFDYSQTWQLVINTGTTIVTFLMVFLIQKTQNKDSLALHLKMNELLAANELASNRLVDVESMTEIELRTIQEYYRKLRDLSLGENNLLSSHSIDEAQRRHKIKMKAKKVPGEPASVNL